MDVIPVLDLKDGRAVHARGGERHRYRVVHGSFGTGHDPVALGRAFQDRLGTRSLYVADLDAITGGPLQAGLIQDLAGLGLELLVDAGTATAPGVTAVAAAGAGRVVVGAETLPHLADLGSLVDAADRLVFSLDLRDGHPLTPDPAFARSTPEDMAAAAIAAGVTDLLVLDLARVGADAGPPLALLERLRHRLSDARLLAGGGVRGPDDLRALSGVGCSAALVATALHEGRLDRPTIEAVHASRASRGTTPTGRSSPPPPSTAT